jgi:trk system potassium uptake protein TrkA
MLSQIAATSDVITVEVSATSITALKEANVKKADLFIAVAHSEETNIISATLAKRLGAKKVIARIDKTSTCSPTTRSSSLTWGSIRLSTPSV